MQADLVKLFVYNEALEIEINKILLLFNDIYEKDTKCEKEIENILIFMKKIMNVLDMPEDEKTTTEERIKENLISGDYKKAKDSILSWLTELENALQFYSCKNKEDYEFRELYQYIVECGSEKLYEQMVDRFNQYCEADSLNANMLMTSYNRTLYWGALSYKEKNYELIRNRAVSLTANAEKMIWMYFALSDATSKRIMKHVIHNWISFDHKFLRYMPRHRYEQYFDYDIIPNAGEVFVDGGACMGDTVEAFVKNYPNYKEIYSYEITPDTFKKLEEQVKGIPNVICRCCGISDKKGSMYVNVCEDIGGNRLGEEGEIEVPVVTLDEDITEKISFIKMDIEGAEYGALLGARRHIQEEHPKLAISAYHNNIDIFRLAMLINEMDSSYRFYYRYYGGTLYPNDYVLYAV